jgi:biopolymer transport protein ExbB
MSLKAISFSLVSQIIRMRGVMLWGVLVLGSSLAFAQASASGAASPIAGAMPAVDNPYGLTALWNTADWVARSVLFILLVMSVGSWYLIVVKYIEQSRMTRQAHQAAEGFWMADSIREGASRLEANSPYRFLAEAGAEAAAKHQGMRRHIARDEWLHMSIQSAVDRVQAQSQNGLAFLATVGSTSPFVGLFGTVWGIYHALTAIGISGQASIDKVAGPVGEALIMTAIGLAVAIPAVLGYNWLAKRNKAVMDEVREFGEELNGVLVGSSGQAA